MWNTKDQGSNESLAHGDWLRLSVGRGERGKGENWWFLQAYQGDCVSSPDIFLIASDEMLQGFRKNTSGHVSQLLYFQHFRSLEENSKNGSHLAGI